MMLSLTFGGFSWDVLSRKMPKTINRQRRGNIALSNTNKRLLKKIIFCIFVLGSQPYPTSYIHISFRFLQVLNIKSNHLRICKRLSYEAYFSIAITLYKN